MQLILVRHAEAVSVGHGGVRSDFDRHLTAHGQATARALADRLKAMGVRVNAVMSSPLVRARQTAEPLLELADTSELTVCDHLAPDTLKPKKVSAAITDLGVKSAIVVGHLPDIAHYTSWLIGAEGRGIEFDKGTAALVEIYGAIGEGCGSLAWLVSPSWYSGES